MNIPFLRECPFRGVFRVPPPVGRGNTDDYLCGWTLPVFAAPFTFQTACAIIKGTRTFCSHSERRLGMKLNNGKKLTALVLAIVMLATIVSATIPASAAVSDVSPNNWAYEAVQ